ncbi:12467_t:CDS:1, partial [Acaulospora morrowiae]
MDNNFAGLPDKKCYLKYNKKIFFSYPTKDSKSFQVGYLGIGPSSVSGSLHLRYPNKSPLHVNKINITLTG